MRRQEQYSDSGVNPYIAAQMQHGSGQRMMEHKPGNFQGRAESFTSEKEGQWRWEREGSKISNPMSPHMFNEGQGGDASRSFYQGQRPDSKLGLDKQVSNDNRPQPREEDTDTGYEDKPMLQNFEGLEQKFHDDIMNLTKENGEAEDAENARHREKINAINAQYQEQLAALRVRHASRRDEFLRKEAHARHQQYQQALIDHLPKSSSLGGPGISHGYGGDGGGVATSASAGEAHRAYNADQFDSYRERARFLGGSRDQGYEQPPRGPYPGGRVYDTGSRYY